MNPSDNPDLIFLDRNEYSYEIAPLIEQTIRSFSPKEFTTYTRCFQQGIKSELSRYLGALYNVPETDVILGYGGEDILKSVIHCFLSLGHQQRKILIPAYSWWYYKSIAEEVDGQTLMYPLYEDGYDFKYDIPEMKRLLREEKPDMLLLASPNNPTGNSLQPAEIKYILSAVDEHTIVIIDEAYTLFNQSDISYIAPLIARYPNTIIIRTFSKFYGLPGLRLGFAFMGKSLQPFLKFSTKYLGYNKLSEKIGIAALQSTEFYLEKAALMRQDKALYQQELNPLDGFKVYNSDANFVLIKYPIALKEKLQKAFADKRIVVKFMNEDGLRTHLRITLGTPDINKQVIEVLKSTHLNS
ncbi:MAG: aminotransferase class I/II-fold pyridoxal phosphate-dependent enzyme [Dysgonamonadaceae bacterium]|jgi:histidinol-phosphate aminotransferase|nr:aminotransferase class I/II-fold pyridoxal phosphate-dependent enzyme [Dysgonamonadaceae bacterium]